MPRACLKALEPCPLLANPCRLLVTSVAAQRGAAAPVLCSALSSPPTLPVHLSLACQAEAGGQPFLAGRRLHLNPLTCCWSSLLASLPAVPASACVTRDRELPGVGELALGGVTLREREAAIMAWRSRLGEAGDTSLELSLGLPAYFAKPPSGLDAGEEPGDAAAAKGSDGSKSRVRPAAAAAPVVGWPPVRSFRRNLASSRQSPQSSSARHHGGGVKDGGAKGSGAGEGGRKGGFFVKINMDGVPIGRKVDLTAYGGYAELSAAVGKLFRGLLAAQRDPAGAGAVSRRGGEEEVDADEPVIGGEYTLVYEDEEGDRVLVGDVPWEMFVATAKRLRVLKSSDLPASSLRAGGSRKRAAAGC